MSTRTRYDAADKVARASLKLADCLARFADLDNPSPVSANEYCREYWDAWGQRLHEYERATPPNGDTIALAMVRTDGEG